MIGTFSVDKGSGVAGLNKSNYIKSISKIINDKHKFEELTNGRTLTREGKFVRLLRDLNKNNNIDNDINYNIYPSGSQPQD